MKVKSKNILLKKVTAIVLAAVCTFSLCQTQPITVRAQEKTDELEAGIYEVPIASLESAAPLPAVQTAFAGAFGDSVLLEVEEDGSMNATANCQNMIISLYGTDYYANILTVENATYNSYKTEKSSLAFGSAETADKEVPDEITFPLELNEDGNTVLTITVDFMNNFLGGGSDYPTNVTLTLDFEQAQKVETEVELTEGTYEVNVELYHATKDQLSMAAGALTGNANISVKDNVATMYLYTQELTVYGVTAYMQGIKVPDTTGNYTEGTLVSQDEEGNPTCFSFVLPSTEEFLNVYVNEMGRDMEARLRVDYTSLNKISDKPMGDDNTDSDSNTDGDNTDSDSNIDSDNTVSNTDDDNTSNDNADNDNSTTEELAEGTYEVSVALWHATKDQLSMAASAILEKAKIIVKDDTATMIIYTQPMSFGTITASLQELRVADLLGNYIDATIVAKDVEGNPTAFSFVLPHRETFLALKVNPHVAMMGNMDLDARLYVDYATLTKLNNTTTTATTVAAATTATTTTATTTSATVITVTGTEGWNQVNALLETISAQGTVTVNMIGTTVVPGTILAGMKGQDKTLVLQMENGVKWSINGLKITESNPKDIDMGVTLNGNSIPDEIVNGIVENGTGSLELSLNHEGDFGFEATLTVSLGSQYAGQYANLYYYNNATGKMELVGSYSINENGEAELTFTHASEYVIVMDTASRTLSAPKTGDETNMVIPICLLMVGIFTAIMAGRRYKTKYFIKGN
ncbi:MAG: NEAT domain-containing protein [Roseburia sp.]